MKSKMYLIGILCFILTSCNLVIDEVSSWMDIEEGVEIPSKRHLLEEDDIKISLPIDFKRLSLYAYQRRLDSVATKAQYKTEVDRINSLIEMEGNFYLFFDRSNNASYIINTMPHFPITRQDASYLLGIMGEGLRKNARVNHVDFEKITGKYNSNNGRQTFKAIYKMYNEETNALWYSSIYVISANRKTVWIQLNTPFMINFDPMVHKMIF